jgi:hypothetical protein
VIIFWAPIMTATKIATEIATKIAPIMRLRTRHAADKELKFMIGAGVGAAG